MLYPDVQILITLRCNLPCLNCVKLCGMKSVTGLDYTKSDMTIGQIEHFIDSVKSLSHYPHPILGKVCVTGGEPLLHTKVKEIVNLLERELVNSGLAEMVFINSNAVLEPPPELKKYVITWSTAQVKELVHNVMLWHPTELGPKFGLGPPLTYKTCKGGAGQYALLLTHNGYSMCYGADGYIRLFCLDHLIIDYLPAGVNEFPVDRMDDVCQHCVFGYGNDVLPRDWEYGRPVSTQYSKEAQLNRRGRSITKQFPERGAIVAPVVTDNKSIDSINVQTIIRNICNGEYDDSIVMQVVAKVIDANNTTLAIALMDRWLTNTKSNVKKIVEDKLAEINKI